MSFFLWSGGLAVFADNPLRKSFVLIHTKVPSGSNNPCSHLIFTLCSKCDFRQMTSPISSCSANLSRTLALYQVL